MKKLFLCAFAIASLSACKKDSENTPSKTELLTSKNWRITAFTSTTTTTVSGSSPTVNTSDEYAQYKPCEKDNFYKFNTDKTLVFNEGASKCSATDPQTSSLTWDFNGDQTKLLVSSGSATPATDDILELSASTLRIRDTQTYTSGSSTFSSVNTITFTSF